MNKFRVIGAIIAGLAMLAPGASLADAMSGHHMMSGDHMMSGASKDVQFTPSRFSGPGVYTGAPALGVTLSMVIAGGGPKDFDTVTLVKSLAGKLAGPELTKLTNQYGKGKIGSFVTVFDYVVNDTLAIVTKDKVALPSAPNPDPKNGEALSGALWAAGQTGKGFSTEVMLDRAVSHPIHIQVMKDIDAKYGIAADANYHAVLNTAMHDLAVAYHLNAEGKMRSM